MDKIENACGKNARTWYMCPLVKWKLPFPRIPVITWCRQQAITLTTGDQDHWHPIAS